MKNKLLISIICTIAITSNLMVGCGKEQTTDNIDGSKSIVIWTNMENEANVLKEYGEKWESETGNKVEVIHETSDLQQFAQATKSSGGPDGIYGIANDQLANYISADLVQEVPEDIYNNDDFVEASIQACYSNGKKYGIPIAVETNTLFYNTDKVESKPETWEELLEVAKNKGGVQFDATSIYYDLGFLRAYDSYIFNYENGKYDVEDIGLGNNEAIKGYKFINKLVNEYKFITSETTSDIAKSSFQNGESAFYIGGPWDIDGFTNAGTPFAVAPMPTLNGKEFVTPVGTQVGFVSSKSKNQDSVWEFYKYISNNASVDLYNVGSRIPASLEAQDKIEKDAFTEAFIAQVANGEPMPTVSEMGQVWTPYADNIKMMFNGQLTEEEAAEYIMTQVKDGISLMHSGE